MTRPRALLEIGILAGENRLPVVEHSRHSSQPATHEQHRSAAAAAAEYGRRALRALRVRAPRVRTLLLPRPRRRPRRLQENAFLF